LRRDSAIKFVPRQFLDDPRYQAPTRVPMKSTIGPYIRKLPSLLLDPSQLILDDNPQPDE